VDQDRETAADTLRQARHALADLIIAEYEHGPTRSLGETRATLEAEIQTLEAALGEWDDHAGRRAEDD
jgi:hypothetical protein